MADPHTADAPERVLPPAGSEDPLAADRRTLVIGASAMVVLILIGVVSAQLFARSGCAAVVAPEPAEPVATTAAPEDVVDDRLASIDGARAVDIVEQATGARVATAIPVGQATRVAPLGGGLVTTGATVTSFDASLAPVATYTTDDLVVGDGPAVHDLNVPNEGTGQTDAFVPLTGTGLDVGACVDAAVVGSPFAFLLDAGDGELLLFRADEDGEAPHLQLRDATAETRWDAPLPLPAGPPGTLAERLTARLGPATVVTARRVGPQEETATPALVAMSRDDGAVLFELDADALAAAGDLDPAEPIRWEVAAVGHDTALVHGRPDPLNAATADGEAAAGGSLLLLDLADGSVIATTTGIGTVTAAADRAAADDRYVIASEPVDGDRGGTEQVAVVGADGTVTPLGGLVDEARFAWVGDRVLVAARDSLSRLAPSDEAMTGGMLPGGRFADVTVTSDGRVATLVTPRDGGEAVLLVTTPTDAVATGG